MEKTNDKLSYQIQENRASLIDLFPEVYQDGKIDLHILQKLIGKNHESEEKYELIWPGKEQAKEAARKKPLHVLYPDPAHSVNWHKTNNLYLEGDNLEVLRIMKQAYEQQVKMIYIDPPYNTGNNFIYRDHFKAIDNGKKSEQKLSTKALSDCVHTNWLHMMYPRLKIARHLLSDDGVIFLSIDERELANLKKICDEIFGEENFIEIFVWTKTNTPPSLSHKSRKTVEYILCYEKQRNSQKYKGEPLTYEDAPLLNTGNPVKILAFPAGSIHFNIPDGTIESGERGRLKLLNDLIIKEGVNQNKIKLQGEFKWVQKTVDKEIKKGTYFLIKTNHFSIRFQRVVNENHFKAPTNYIRTEQMETKLNPKLGIGTNETAAKELKSLGLDRVFDYPKPVSLIKYLIRATTDKDDLIMDFFAGSSTTAQAVMELNQEDGGKRNFIMIQIPEVIPEQTKAYEAGFKNLCEIGRERMKRAGEKIAAADKKEHLDIGFKVFAEGESSVAAWKKASKQKTNQPPSPQMEENILYEALLKHGISLTETVQKHSLSDQVIYEVKDAKVIICLSFGLTIGFFQQLFIKFPNILQIIIFESAIVSDQQEIYSFFHKKEVRLTCW